MHVLVSNQRLDIVTSRHFVGRCSANIRADVEELSTDLIKSQGCRETGKTI